MVRVGGGNGKSTDDAGTVSLFLTTAAEEWEGKFLSSTSVEILWSSTGQLYT